MKIEFEGIPSGDYESFCWDVDRDTYIRIKTERYQRKGWSFDRIKETVDELIEYEKSYYHDGAYRIYPNDIIINESPKQRVIIETEII